MLPAGGVQSEVDPRRSSGRAPSGLWHARANGRTRSARSNRRSGRRRADRLDDPADALGHRGTAGLDRAGLAVVVAEADRAASSACPRARPRAAGGSRPSVVSWSSWAGPLEGVVRLRHEPADRDRATDVVAPGDPHGPWRSPVWRGPRSRRTIVVGLRRQAITPCPLPPAATRGSNAVATVRIRSSSVTILLLMCLAHPFRAAAASGERQAGAAPLPGELLAR